jgi:nucleotide-binding universal stress UspA family protein
MADAYKSPRIRHAGVYDDILLPIDGSDAADAAVEHAADLARTYDATVHVFSAVEPIPSAEADVATILETMQADAERIVGDVADRLRDAGVDATTDVRTGSAYRTIIAYAEEPGVDLIVMGTHGRSGVGRVLLGSVTEKVVRHADVPVMTVRQPEDAENEDEAGKGGDEE